MALPNFVRAVDWQTSILPHFIQTTQNHRKVALSEAGHGIDNLPLRKWLNPRGKAVAGIAQFRICGVVESGHSSAYACRHESGKVRTWTN